jgi:hypothetical protein
MSGEGLPDLAWDQICLGCSLLTMKWFNRRLSEERRLFEPSGAGLYHEGNVGRFSNLPKEGERILPMVTTEFAPQSHGKVASENLTLAPMKSGRRELGC